MQKLYFTIALVATVNLLVYTSESAWSQEKSTNKKRIALIIGNADYANVAKLNNPTNDAQDLAKELRNLGFEVTKKENVENSKEMRELVYDFGNKLRDGGVGLFYYSGHGIQVKGENYLIPTAANLKSEADVNYEALGMGYVQETLDAANNGMNIVILDACRDNPFARSIRRSTRGAPTLGLAQIDSAKGSLVAFATSPGATAEDGSGRNGTYTKHLLANIKQPGLNVEGLFKRVRNGVNEETDGQQTPWESTSLTGDFCFAGCEDPTFAQTKTEAERLRKEIEQQKLETERLKAEAKILKQQQAAIQKLKIETTHVSDQEQDHEQAIPTKQKSKSKKQARLKSQKAARQQALEKQQRAELEDQEATARQQAFEEQQKAKLEAQEAARKQSNKTRINIGTF